MSLSQQSDSAIEGDAEESLITEGEDAALASTSSQDQSFVIGNSEEEGDIIVHQGVDSVIEMNTAANTTPLVTIGTFC